MSAAESEITVTGHPTRAPPATPIWSKLFLVYGDPFITAGFAFPHQILESLGWPLGARVKLLSVQFFDILIATVHGYTAWPFPTPSEPPAEKV